MSRAVPALRRSRFGTLRLVALVAGGLLAGCAGGALPAATAGDAARVGAQLADLDQGRSLVAAKCGGCHRTPLPTEHTSADWPHMLDEMARRSNVTGSQRQLMQQYLVTMASR
jgi:mono/diheme cytochrome c family protein